MNLKEIDANKIDDMDLGIKQPATPKLEKCDLCGEEWDLGPNNTRLVYCYICGGKFDLECWVKQRQDEKDRGEYKEP
jgi:hypothetical protein